MKKLLIIFFLFLALALVALGDWPLLKQPAGTNAPPSQRNLINPHFYQNPKVSLRDINLKIFYVVPNNLQAAESWHSDIAGVLDEVVKFHEVQFHNASRLSADIYPSPVILSREDIFYDTPNTDFGNPQGLKNIDLELEARFPKFLQVPSNSYLAMAIIYEGLGASGAPNAMILSRTFLSQEEYSQAKGSLFYHEFAHTFGVPDRFGLSDNRPFSNDVMGSGRYKPLSTNYLGADLLKDLGLISPNK